MSEKPAANFVARLGELPTVQWALNGASKVYTRAREISLFTKCGFLAVEVTAKVAILSSKIAYNVSPIPQFVKDKIQQNIEIADSLACCGLDEIARKYPIITQAASICILPAESSAESDKSTVAVWAGEEQQNSTNLIGTMAHVPVRVTRAGFSGVKYVLSTTMSTTGAVLSHIPLVRSVGFDQTPLTLQPVDTDESSDSGSDDSDDDTPICSQCECTASTKPDDPEEKQQVNGLNKWTAALVGVCLCCCACVCMSVSVCACMCLSTLLCGGVCHCLFIGLWFICR